jgi:hypothetical protein
MRHLTFSVPERILAFLAGLFNLIVGLAFFFLPELHLSFPIWPTTISPVLDRFIGAIIVGNSAGAFFLTFQREWASVRALALVAVVYGTLVALALLYHLLWQHANPVFWLYFLFDTPFLIVYYALFVYHDIAPAIKRRNRRNIYVKSSDIGR